MSLTLFVRHPGLASAKREFDPGSLEFQKIPDQEHYALKSGMTILKTFKHLALGTIPDCINLALSS